MCGNGRSKGAASRGGAKSPDVEHEAVPALAVGDLARDLAGPHFDRFEPSLRYTAQELQRLALPQPRLLRGRPHRGDRQQPRLAGIGAQERLAQHVAQQPDEIVELARGDVIGLGRHQRQAVEPAGREHPGQRMAQLLESLDHRAGRQRKVGEGLLPALQGGQQIDQHDLPAQPAEHLAVEAPYQPAVGLVAPDEHGAVAAGPRPGRTAQRKEQLFERHAIRQEAARLQPRQAFGAAALQVVDVGAAGTGQGEWILGSRRIERPGLALPRRRQCRALARSGQFLHLRRPGAIVERQQRQVEQPFAGIVDEVEVQRLRLEQAAIEPRRCRQPQPHPHAAQPFGRRRPARRIGQQVGEALGVGKARQAGNVAQLDGVQAPAPGKERKGLDRRLLGMQQSMHEGRHEHGLPGPLQASDGDAIAGLLERRGGGKGRDDGVEGIGREAAQPGQRCHERATARTERMRYTWRQSRALCGNSPHAAFCGHLPHTPCCGGQGGMSRRYR